MLPGMAKESAAGEGRGSRAALAKSAKMVGLRAAEGRGPKGQQPHHFRPFPRRPAPPRGRRTFLSHGGRVRLVPAPKARSDALPRIAEYAVILTFTNSLYVDFDLRKLIKSNYYCPFWNENY